MNTQWCHSSASRSRRVAWQVTCQQVGLVEQCFMNSFQIALQWAPKPKHWEEAIAQITNLKSHPVGVYNDQSASLMEREVGATVWPGGKWRSLNLYDMIAIWQTICDFGIPVIRFIWGEKPKYLQYIHVYMSNISIPVLFVFTVYLLLHKKMQNKQQENNHNHDLNIYVTHTHTESMLTNFPALSFFCLSGTTFVAISEL